MLEREPQHLAYGAWVDITAAQFEWVTRKCCISYENTLLIQFQTLFVSYTFLTIQAPHYLVIQKLWLWGSCAGNVACWLAVA